MNNLKGTVTSGTPMPKCKKPKQDKEYKTIFKIKANNDCFDIIATEKGIEITCEYENGRYQNAYTLKAIHKKQALKMANSIIEYYATKYV